MPKSAPASLEQIILHSLDRNKAENIVSIDMRGKADFADRMIVASGTSSRHVSSLADHVVVALKKAGYDPIPVEGQDSCNWVLVDAGDIVVHIFHPETRGYYGLEKMWSVEIPRLEAAY